MMRMAHRCGVADTTFFRHYLPYGLEWYCGEDGARHWSLFGRDYNAVGIWGWRDNKSGEAHSFRCAALDDRKRFDFFAGCLGGRGDDPAREGGRLYFYNDGCKPWEGKQEFICYALVLDALCKLPCEVGASDEGVLLPGDIPRIGDFILPATMWIREDGRMFVMNRLGGACGCFWNPLQDASQSRVPDGVNPEVVVVGDWKQARNAEERAVYKALRTERFYLMEDFPNLAAAPEHTDWSPYAFNLRRLRDVLLDFPRPVRDSER